MTVDALMLLATLLLAVLLAGLLILRRAFEALPLFFTYQVYSAISAGVGYAALRYFATAYFRYVIVATALDAVLYLVVLFELAGNVLEFNRQGRSRRGGWLFMSVAFSALLWPLALWTAPASFGPLWNLFSIEMHATTIVEVAAIVSLLTWGRLLKLRWSETGLRIVTGMGVWPLVGLGVLIVHGWGVFSGEYRWLDDLVPASAILALLYWVHYFWVVVPSTARAVTASTVLQEGR
jgi:hypothetical protein